MLVKSFSFSLIFLCIQFLCESHQHLSRGSESIAITMYFIVHILQIWPLGSTSSCLPCHLTCPQSSLNTSLLSGTIILFQAHLVLSLSQLIPQGVLVHFTWKRYSKKQDLGPRFAYYYWDIIVLRPSWWAELGNRYVYIHICLSFYIFRTMSSYTSDSNPFLTFPLSLFIIPSSLQLCEAWLSFSKYVYLFSQS